MESNGFAPAPDRWVITENITATVTEYVEVDGGDVSDCLELRVVRMSEPGEYILRCAWDGELSVNGRPFQPGDDQEKYETLFWAMAEPGKVAVGYTELIRIYE